MPKPLLPLLAAAMIIAPLASRAADTPAPSPPPASAAPAAKPAAAKPTTKLGQCSSEARKKGLKGDERKKFISQCTKS